MQVFQELTSIGGVDDLIILSAEDLRKLYAQLDRKINNISRRNVTGIKKIQFFLKHLQQRGDYEIGPNFNYSSINENDFHNFKCHPFNDLSCGIDSRHIFLSSTPRKLLDSFAPVHEESTMIKFEKYSFLFLISYKRDRIIPVSV